jgi:hypothetical protein
LLDGIFMGLVSMRFRRYRPAPSLRIWEHFKHSWPGRTAGFCQLADHRGAGVQRGGPLVAEPLAPLLANIPVFKSIYNSVKKVSDTLFSSNGNAFRTALLVQYPRVGSWTIAFQTGSPGGEVARHLGNDFVSVYVPTTPNPTSGFS